MTISASHNGFTLGKPLSINWSITSVIDGSGNAQPDLVTSETAELTVLSPLYEFTIPALMTQTLAGYTATFSVSVTEAFTD